MEEFDVHAINLFIDSEQKTRYITKLAEIFGTSVNWFLAGSFANEKVINPNDIDLYFYSEGNYRQAKSLFDKHPKCRFMVKSKFAETYDVKGIEIPVQFITKLFGQPQQIFDSMDINVCKQAILPNHNHVADVTAFESLQLTEVSIDSFSRYLKYYQRYHPKRNLDKAFCYLFETYLEDDSFVTSYYTNQPPMQVNKVLYTLFNTHKKYGTTYMSRRVQEYILGLVHTHTPELLL